jgi:hypothetical protein
VRPEDLVETTDVSTLPAHDGDFERQEIFLRSAGAG